MKKIISSLIVLFTITTHVKAQEVKKGYVGISVGPSFPLGDFASKNGDNQGAGWAKMGLASDISFAYLLGEGNYGITALLRGAYILTDAQAYADEFGTSLPDVTWSVESKPWMTGSCMVGGFRTFPMNKKSDFHLRSMLGVLGVNSPEINTTVVSPAGTGWIKRDKNTSISFIYLLGAGFNFDLGNKFMLLTNLDYSSSKPEFTGVVTTTDLGNREKDTWSQHIETIQISLGLAIKL